MSTCQQLSTIRRRSVLGGRADTQLHKTIFCMKGYLNFGFGAYDGGKEVGGVSCAVACAASRVTNYKGIMSHRGGPSPTLFKDYSRLLAVLATITQFWSSSPLFANWAPEMTTLVSPVSVPVTLSLYLKNLMTDHSYSRRI
jgi:hypothetical protein